MVRELIEKIAKALVDNPDKVEVKEVEGEHISVLELRVAKEDVGKIIGKGGAHAQAIRNILKAISRKKGKKYNLEILD
jgi:predicted RNA-binding protein YlqC (UPF0109 family)